MQHRNAIVQLISEIVRTPMNKLQAIAAIRKRAKESIADEEQNRFIELVEREIQSLHEGSLARYRIHPQAYESWKKHWL